MEVSKYILLFHKKLKGKISPQEQSELSEWLRKENQQGFSDDMEGLWTLSGRYKQGYEPDVEAGLARFQSRIAAVRRNRQRRLRLLSAAAAIALLLAAGWWWASEYARPDSGGAIAYSSPPGQAKEIFLPDGSQVLLNESSFLSVSESFTAAGTRQVELSGEAYFKVQADPRHPFLINTTDASVEVMGTAFNLRAYPVEGFTEVEVEEGKVRLSERHGKAALEVLPGERGICQPGKPLTAKKPPALNAHSWRTGKLSFRNTPLREALPALERHFNVEIELDSPKVADCKITMAFEKSSLEEVLEALRLIFQFDIDEAGQQPHFVLRHGNCNPNASASE